MTLHQVIPLFPGLAASRSLGKTTEVLETSYESYELCDMDHVDVSDSQFYICKVTVMVIPKAVVGKSRVKPQILTSVYILFESNKLDS